jgi:hypothetical protein
MPTKQGESALLRMPTSVAGVVGGVGTTTVSRVLGELAEDIGVTVPEWRGTPILLVTHSTAASLLRAAAVGRALTSTAQSVRVVLAVVADGPYPQPGTVRSRIRALSPSLVGHVHLPYVEAWRYIDDPLSAPMPRAYARGVRALSRLINRS